MKNKRFFLIARNILFAVTFFLLLPALLYFSKGDSSCTVPPEAAPLSEGWYYTEGNRRIEVTLPAVITGIEGQTLYLCNDSLKPADSALTLTTRAAVYEPKVFLNNRELYRYQEAKFRRNAQMRSKVNCLFQLPDIKEGDVLTLCYTRDNVSASFKIPEILMGQSSAMILYLCKNNIFTIGIICLMYLLGIISFSIYCYLSYMHIQEPRLLNLTGFLLLCGTWCLTDSSLVQLFSSAADTVLYLSFFCFLLFAVPMIRFVQHTANMSEHRIFDYITFAFYLNAIVQILLHFTLNIDMIDMLFATHICLIAGISLLIFTMSREYRKSQEPEFRSIRIAFLVLSFFGVLALFLYWAVNFTWYQEIYECGILLFIIMLLYRVLITLTENFQAKTEMEVYLRLSKFDEMTNLKNRRSFNEDTAALEFRTRPEENPLLIFFDLNFLKQVNDNHGHSAGDELIVSTARILQKVYGPEHCYRIGGDEFAAILPEPYDTIEELEKHLNEEIELYNQNERNLLSIARGYSTLLDKQGRAKTISDWKCEADQNMYKHKLADKLRRARLPKDLSEMELLLHKYGLADLTDLSGK